MITKKVGLIGCAFGIAAIVAAKADQLTCSAIPLNSDGLGNIGVLVPAKAKITGGRLEIRNQDIIGDKYTDCSTQGLCPQPHGDASNVSYAEFPDEDGMQGRAFLVYNMRGAHVKIVRLCYSYQLSDKESTENRLNPKFLDLKPYNLLEECVKKAK
jgi:hypothetical protein